MTRRVYHIYRRSPTASTMGRLFCGTRRLNVAALNQRDANEKIREGKKDWLCQNCVAAWAKRSEN